ncbi:MAG: ATP-binding protein [candidate division KSB1 bacterium]|nr:ATP-binding protein [candidate division KSB1 bacterium]MDQ7065813.1 ATP-binding protein [candidate division KSB1 bacterium]
MAKEAFTTKILGPDKEVICVQIRPDVDAQALVLKLEKFFTILLRKGHKKWLFDLEAVPFPTNSLIAFLISATHQARQAGGEVKLIHIQNSASNNFLTFNPLSYISVEENQNSALAALGVPVPEEETHQQDILTPPIEPLKEPEEAKPETVKTKTEKTRPAESTPEPAAKPATEKKALKEETPAFGEVDIVDPPLWDNIEEDEPFVKMSSSPIITDDDDDAGAPSQQDTIKIEEPSTQPAVQASDETFNGKNQYHLRAESLASNLYKICDFVVEHAEKAGIDEKEVAKIKISVYEAALNVIEHAYHSKPDNWIDVYVNYDRSMFKIVIQDYGLSFEKAPPKQYDVEAAVERRQTGGFGLHIIRRSMDVVDYVADPIDGNKLTLIKYLN